MTKVKTRFAPSPTGFLHVGGLRTALFSYLWAKKNEGKFLLRIEDTDRERFVKGAEENILKTLADFGMNPDKIFRQSDRLATYKKYVEQLLKQEKAYEEKGEKGTAIRFKTPKTGITEWEDSVYEKMQFKNDAIKDPIILKSDGYPVYNFANVIDDHEMEITDVIRGEEFLSSTPIHIKLYEALGWQAPKSAHVPLILDKDRKKLSKRTGDVAVHEYLKKGYLKPALLNFIVLLGWNPKTTAEIFSLENLLEVFEIKKINKAGAIFDVTKLDFINREWQKKLGIKPENDPLYQRALKIVTKKFSDSDESKVIKQLLAIWPQIIERVQGPSDLDEKLNEFDFYFKEPKYDPEILVWKKMTAEQTKINLAILKDFISKIDEKDFIAGVLEKQIKDFIQEKGIKTGEALWPLRAALSGQKNSPSPFEIMEILKLEKSLARIESAISILLTLDDGF